MNRRSFLKAVAAVFAAVIAPITWAKRKLFVIYGDGVHDDSEALQAAIKGDPVHYPDGDPLNRFGGRIWLRPGTYKVGTPLVDGKATWLPDSTPDNPGWITKPPSE